MCGRANLLVTIVSLQCVPQIHAFTDDERLIDQVLPKIVREHEAYVTLNVKRLNMRLSKNTRSKIEHVTFTHLITCKHELMFVLFTHKKLYKR